MSKMDPSQPEESRFRALFQRLPMMIVIVDRHRRVLMANTMAGSASGRHPDELVGLLGGETGRAHIHVILILEPDGNIALGKLQMEKVMLQLAPHVR